jgi:hypothetical protein
MAQDTVGNPVAEIFQIFQIQFWKSLGKSLSTIFLPQPVSEKKCFPTKYRVYFISPFSYIS